MRRTILLLWVLSLAVTSAWPQSFRYKKLEDVHFAWNGQPMEFIVERQIGIGESETVSAPARIRILNNGLPIAAFELQWGITQFKGENARQATFPANLAESRYLLFANISHSKPPLLLAFGPIGGDPLGPGYAYGLDASGKPHQLLAKENFGFARFSEFGRTGEAKIITVKCGTHGSGKGPSPYDPFLVWRIRENDVAFDKALTRSYNEQNYVWAGTECRDDVRAVKNEAGEWKLRKTTEPAREPGEEVHDLNNEPHS
jgi:hypothetical protein